MLKQYGGKVMSWKKAIKKYLIHILLFLFFIIIIFSTQGNKLINIFAENFFVNGKYINNGTHYIIGEFRVVKFGKFSLLLWFTIYSVIFFDIYRNIYTDRKRDKVKNIKEISNRIMKITARKTVAENNEYYEIDNAIQNILNSQSEFKEQYNDNMAKLNLSMAFLAHDLRTPLTAIIGYTDLLTNEKELSASSQEKYLNIVKDKSLELENLINQFFDFTKEQLKSENIAKNNFDLFEFFVQIRETFYPYLTSKNLDMILSIPEKQQIYADPNALARSFNNIIKNAVLYSKVNSTIKITFEKIDRDCIIIVQNKVENPDTINIDNIFQPFYRGDYSRNSEIKGSGLGLNVAKTIIEKHNGEIKAKLFADYIEMIIKLPLEDSL